jgi:hypothetical protein
MENFFNWATKPVPNEDVEVWFNINNIIPEKGELFFDFCHSLFTLMNQTYLGEDEQPSETRVIMSEEDKTKHFKWCWETTVNNFKKENINFSVDGEHYEYFLTFFTEVYYNQKNVTVRSAISGFFKDLFDKKKTFTKSDLDLYTEMYKLLDKSILK